MKEFDKLGYTQRPDFGFTEDEQLVAYSLRAFLASPIQISTTLETIDDFELSMYCNEEVIAINQDEACDPAKLCIQLEDGKKCIHVFRRVLDGGDRAYMALNLGETAESVTIWQDAPAEVRDVWAKRDLGRTDAVRIRMEPHTVRIFRASAE